MARFLNNRKETKGEAPGSLIFLGNQKTKNIQIRIIRYNLTKLEEITISPEELSADLIVQGMVNWINIDGIHNTELIRKIGLIFDISSMALEDILNPDQRPKIIHDENVLTSFLKFFIFNEEQDKLFTEQISFSLGTGFLITFQEQPGIYFEAVRERIRNSIGRIRKHQTDYLFYVLLDTIVDTYLHNIEKLGRKIELQENVILSSHDIEIINKLYTYKNELIYLRKTVRPVKEITLKLQSIDSKFFTKKTAHFFADLDDLATQSVESIEIYYSMVSDQLNIYNTNLSNRANEVMKVLTIFASIFIPLTFIAGVYGTNFEFIPELKIHFGYFAMLIIMAMVAIAMLLYFRKKKFL